MLILDAKELKDRGTIMSTQSLRLASLYKILTPSAEAIPFKFLPEQWQLFCDMVPLNLIPKARQLGITTFVQLYMLDTCLWTPNIRAGIVAHTMDDAKRFFRDKVKFAYDSMPEWAREDVSVVSNSADTLTFSNGSSIRVSTSHRSGTMQLLHISELAALCRLRPEAADEVVEGALNTVTVGQQIFVESTMKNPYDKFSRMCKAARAFEESGDPFTPMDWKLHFFGWTECERYRLDGAVPMVSREVQDHFMELESDYGIVLDNGQKTWFIKKLAEQGWPAMHREFPATLDESLAAADEGVVYAKEMRAARQEGRITQLPYNPNNPIMTCWDLGRNDCTSIWFFQKNGPWFDFLWYEEDSGHALHHYAELVFDLKAEKHWIMGRHYLPHDVEVTELTNRENKTRKEVLEGLGVSPIEVVPRIPLEIDGIEMMRQVFSICRFDEEGCGKGLEHLSTFRFERDQRNDRYKDTPKKGPEKHAADAIRQFAQGWRAEREPYNDDSENRMLRANRNRYGYQSRAAHRRRRLI